MTDFERFAARFVLQKQPSELERPRQMRRKPFETGDIGIVKAFLVAVLKETDQREPAIPDNSGHPKASLAPRGRKKFVGEYLAAVGNFPKRCGSRWRLFRLLMLQRLAAAGRVSRILPVTRIICGPSKAPEARTIWHSGLILIQFSESRR